MNSRVKSGAVELLRHTDASQPGGQVNVEAVDLETNVNKDQETNTKTNHKRSIADIIDLESIKSAKRRAIMELVMLTGLSCKEISADRNINISEAGVRWHLTLIYKQFGVKDRLQLLSRYEAR